MELSGRLDYLRKISAAGLIALAAWVSSFSPAQAKPNWASLGPADLPAHLKVIKFRTGNVIDLSNSVCWGRWCVSFGSEPPVVEYLSMSGASEGMGIRIQRLECKNPVAGDKPCSMVFMTSEPWTDNYTSCTIVGDDIKQIDIRCPTDLILE